MTEGAAVGVAAAATNPIGWFVLGASESVHSEQYSWDCWKPILHDQSQRASKGRLLRDVFCDERVRTVISYGLNQDDPEQCRFIVENVWDETFEINAVVLSNDKVAFHATKSV